MKNDIISRIHKLGSPRQLAALRIGIGIQIFMAVHSQVFPLLSKVYLRQNVKSILPDTLNVFVGAHLVEALVVTCKILSIFLILGLGTKIILPILTFSFILLYNFYYLGIDAPVQWLYLWFPLIVLCLSDPHHAWSIDTYIRKHPSNLSQNYRWPIELCVLWFVYIYFAAGLSKFFPFENGIRWLETGSTTQYIVYFRFLDSPLYYIFEKPFFDYSKSNLIWQFASLYTLVSELFAIVMIFTNKFHLHALCLILFLHFSIYLTGIGAFMQTAIVLGICLLPQSLFDKRLAQ